MEEKDKNINENGCADSTVEGNDVDTNTENAAGEKAAEACPDDKKETPESENAEKEEKDPLTAAKEEIEALKDKYLRSVAEFDNYRKRTMKEKAELILNGSEKAVQAILPDAGPRPFPSSSACGNCRIPLPNADTYPVALLFPL